VGGAEEWLSKAKYKHKKRGASFLVARALSIQDLAHDCFPQL
jgi:hypothetical protein